MSIERKVHNDRSKTSELGGWIIKDRGNASQEGPPILNYGNIVIRNSNLEILSTIDISLVLVYNMTLC